MCKRNTPSWSYTLLSRHSSRFSVPNDVPKYIFLHHTTTVRHMLPKTPANTVTLILNSVSAFFIKAVWGESRLGGGAMSEDAQMYLLRHQWRIKVEWQWADDTYIFRYYFKMTAQKHGSYFVKFMLPGPPSPHVSSLLPLLPSQVGRTKMWGKELKM